MTFFVSDPRPFRHKLFSPGILFASCPIVPNPLGQKIPAKNDETYGVFSIEREGGETLETPRVKKK